MNKSTKLSKSIKRKPDKNGHAKNIVLKNMLARPTEPLHKDTEYWALVKINPQDRLDHKQMPVMLLHSKKRCFVIEARCCKNPSDSDWDSYCDLVSTSQGAFSSPDHPESWSY